MSNGRPESDIVEEVAEDATVGELDIVPGGEWVPPPSTRLGTTANSPSPDTGKVTGVKEAKRSWSICKILEYMKLRRKLLYCRHRTQFNSLSYLLKWQVSDGLKFLV